MNRTSERGQVGMGILICFGVFVLIGVVLVGGYLFKWWFAPYEGKLEARQQINSGDFRIQAYDHFFNLCASVQGVEAVIDATDQQLQAVTDPKEIQRLNTNKVGLIAARADAVNQYNADTRKSYTIGQFRASGLPFSLPSEYESGVHTSCGS